MPKTISASEAKNSLGSVIEWAVENQDEVIVESRGKPKAVIMPFDDYEEYQQLREQARRRAVLARLEKLAETIGARNQDLTAETADALEYISHGMSEAAGTVGGWIAQAAKRAKGEKEGGES